MATNLITDRVFLKRPGMIAKLKKSVISAVFVVCVGCNTMGEMLDHSRIQGKTGTITGTVRFLGVQSRENAADAECEGPFPNYEVVIRSIEDGRVVSSVTSDADGKFSVALAEGRYRIQTQRGLTKMDVYDNDFSIRAGEETTLELMVDTGIR